MKSTGRQWLIAQNLESHNQIFFSIGNQQDHYQCRINELRGRRIRACFHGWVILSNHPDSVLWSLWNPLTSKLIRLPPLHIHDSHEHEHEHECCLTAPPKDHASVFLLTTTGNPSIVFCRLDRKRKRLKWTEMSYAKQLKSISGEDRFLQSPTCCNGKVYALVLGAYFRFVIEVDIAVKEKEVVIRLLPLVKVPHTSYSRCPPVINSFCKIRLFLKGSCADLFYIGVCFNDGNRIGNVYLFKLDFTRLMWEDVVDLKDATFFLDLASDYSACYYASAVDSQLEGYVHILGDLGKVVYSFHAQDRTMTISSTPCPVQESEASTWAMLELRLKVDHVELELEKEGEGEEEGDSIDLDNTRSESRLLNIPFHILEKIMKLCIGIEYMMFRATCKHCYLAAPLIQWSTKTTLKRLQMYSLDSPWLMVLDNIRGIITFIDPVRGGMYFMKTPQELKVNYHIFCSRFGWLLIYRFEDDPQLAFFNPITRNIRKLPNIHYLQSFCFSAPPTSPDCMVVGFTTYEPWHMFIHFVSRDSTWRIFRLPFGDDDPYSYHLPTFNGQDVYALCNYKGVHLFRDMPEDGRSLQVVVDEAPRSCCRSPTQHFLSVCDQHVLLVIVGKFGESVEVSELNKSTLKWEKLRGLGQHTIYISDTSCICLEAKSPEMENKIFFPRLQHDDDTKIVFYSLETCRYHTSDDKDIEESLGVDLFGTKHPCYPHTWIEPSWS